MNGTYLYKHISKYLCIDVFLIMKQKRQLSTDLLTDMWYDVKTRSCTYDIKTKIGEKQIFYKYQSAIGSWSHRCDRLSFLIALKDLRYYISDKYKLELRNLPVKF